MFIECLLYMTFILRCRGPSWSYGSWIYNYLCHQCLSQLKLSLNPTQERCTRFSMSLSLSVTCGRSVVFSWYSGFLHQLYWPLRYNWNIVESGVKHRNPNPTLYDIRAEAHWPYRHLDNAWWAAQISNILMNNGTPQYC